MISQYPSPKPGRRSTPEALSNGSVRRYDQAVHGTRDRTAAKSKVHEFNCRDQLKFRNVPASLPDIQRFRGGSSLVDEVILCATSCVAADRFSPQMVVEVLWIGCFWGDENEPSAESLMACEGERDRKRVALFFTAFKSRYLCGGLNNRYVAKLLFVRALVWS